MIPVWQELLNRTQKLQIAVMSGQLDGIVPASGTQAWMFPLFGLFETAPDQIYWIDGTGQAAGWLPSLGSNGIGNASLILVKDAGHDVAKSNPLRGQQVARAVLSGQQVTVESLNQASREIWEVTTTTSVGPTAKGTRTATATSSKPGGAVHRLAGERWGYLIGLLISVLLFY